MEACEIIDTWHVLGMRGTGSHDVAVTEVFVPEALTFPTTPDGVPGRHYQGALYRFPIVGIQAMVFPAVALAVARCAMDEVTILAQGKTPAVTTMPLRERASTQVKLAQAEALWRAGRTLLYEALRAAWEVCVGGGDPHPAPESRPAAGDDAGGERRRDRGGVDVECGRDEWDLSGQPLRAVFSGYAGLETPCLLFGTAVRDRRARLRWTPAAVCHVRALGRGEASPPRRDVGDCRHKQATQYKKRAITVDVEEVGNGNLRQEQTLAGVYSRPICGQAPRPVRLPERSAHRCPRPRRRAGDS
jgi:hypothetical protein